MRKIYLTIALVGSCLCLFAQNKEAPDPFMENESKANAFELMPTQSKWEDVNGERVFLEPDIMPSFGTCLHQTHKEKNATACTGEALSFYIKENLRYPDAAKEKGIQGVVVINFIINEKGEPQQLEVLRDIGGGCGEEAKRIIASMPPWVAGQFQGNAVKTRLRLPVRFNLKNSTSNEDFKIVWGTIKGDKANLLMLEEHSYEPIFVRDRLGNEINIDALTFLFERKGKVQAFKSRNALNAQMQKLLRNAKNNDTFVISASIQANGEIIEVEKEIVAIK